MPSSVRARRTSRPAAAEQRHLVPPRGEAAEDLVQVNLGAAGLRILAVLPVDDQDPHSECVPSCRASASSTPFTKRALCGAAEALGERAPLPGSRRAAASRRSQQLRRRQPQHRRARWRRGARVASSSVTLGERRDRARRCRAGERAHDQRAGERALLGADGEVVPDRSATRSSVAARRAGPTHTAPAARAARRARLSLIAVSGIEPIEEVGHLERGEGGIPALVAVRAAGARFGLLHRVAREHAEADRDVEVGARVARARATLRPRRSRSAACRRESRRRARRARRSARWRAAAARRGAAPTRPGTQTTSMSSNATP